VVTGPVVSFVVNATDNSPATVKRVLVVFREVRTEASSEWRSVELVQTPGTNRWTGGALIASSEVEYFVQAVDSAGNVGIAANKGRLHEASSLPSLPPEVTVEPAPGTPAPGSNGWFLGDAIVTITGQGIRVSVDDQPFVAYAGPFAVGGDGIHSVEFRGSDGSGGSVVVPIDTTTPTITIDTPPEGAVYTLGQTVAASYHCTDAGSGVVSCEPVPSGSNIDTTTLGSKSFEVHASDAVGHTSSEAHQYSVVPWVFEGFLPPVDNPPVVNLAKAGSSVPLKWRLQHADGDLIRDIGVVASIQSQKIACATGPQDAVQETLTAGSSGLRYDPANEQFVYAWATQKSWAGTCRQLVLTLVDGTKHLANFRFK
jgi:hypothetical protein